MLALQNIEGRVPLYLQQTPQVKLQPIVQSSLEYFKNKKHHFENNYPIIKTPLYSLGIKSLEAFAGRQAITEEALNAYIHLVDRDRECRSMLFDTLHTEAVFRNRSFESKRRQRDPSLQVAMAYRVPKSNDYMLIICEPAHKRLIVYDVKKRQIAEFHPVL